MNPVSRPFASASRRLLSLSAFAAALPLVPAAFGAALTWDGGGSPDGNFSIGTNWAANVAPNATGDTLTFAGTTNLSAVNDSVTSLATSGTALTFASGAGAFTVSGNALTLGSGGGASQIILSQQSANAQVISANLTLSGGNGDRSIVFATGAGSLTLSGTINFSNDWLFPTTTAGTLILSGTNTGDGKGTNAITAGTNVMRAMMRNNVAGTNLVLGSDSALGNSGSGDAGIGTASLRGIIANQQLNIGTTGGDRNLSGSTLAINANNITFNGANNLAIGNLVNVSGNRDFVVSSTGTVTVATGIFLSNDQTSRQLFNNLSGAGGMVINGKLYNTLHSGGITTTVNDSTATATTGIFRKAGTGSMALNGDSGTTYTGSIQVDGGTLKLGHANALGSTTGATILAGGALDLNGQTIGETLKHTSASSSLINTSATAATVTADATLTANLAINTTGDITLTRLIGTAANRTITKTGAGTLTTNGSSHNNLSTWQINQGTVVFANTSGLAADRGVTLAGGTLRLSGANSNLINDDQAFTLNSGVFDLNGKAEAVAAIGGSGGTIHNGLAASSSTLFVGGGPGGSTSASFAGGIENGSGILALTKEGSGTQTLTGDLTYTGNTTVSAGTLTFETGGSLLFTLADAGVSNQILGTGAANFNGTIKLNLGAVTDTVGSWNLIDVSNLTESYGASISVTDQAGAVLFNNSETASVWKSDDNRWSLDLASGVLNLAAVPEPSACAAIAGLGILGFAAVRRRRQRVAA